jgi:hypothetical protein
VAHSNIQRDPAYQGVDEVGGEHGSIEQRAVHVGVMCRRRMYSDITYLLSGIICRSKVSQVDYTAIIIMVPEQKDNCKNHNITIL